MRDLVARFGAPCARTGPLVMLAFPLVWVESTDVEGRGVLAFRVDDQAVGRYDAMTRRFVATGPQLRPRESAQAAAEQRLLGALYARHPPDTPVEPRFYEAVLRAAALSDDTSLDALLDASTGEWTPRPHGSACTWLGQDAVWAEHRVD